MYRLRDCFQSSSVYNEALIKRFRDNFKPENGSRLWMIPGHIVFTTPDKKVYTCDARPLDLLSPSEPNTGELIFVSSDVVDIFFDTENQGTRMYIGFSNGDVQIFEYKLLLYEWARVGYFNVDIVSPNSTSHHQNSVEKMFLSLKQSAMYWAEKASGHQDMCFMMQKRLLPSSSVREVTQSAVGAPKLLLKNFTDFDIIEIAENVCILPKLPNNVNLYLILPQRCHLWLFDIRGKCLRRGIIADQVIDFVTLCMNAVGLWSQGGSVKACISLDSDTNVGYIFHDNMLLTVLPSGEIGTKTEFNIVLDPSLKYYVLHKTLCFYSSEKFFVHDINTGKLLQTFDLADYGLVRGIWSCKSLLPNIGFYTDSHIHILQCDTLFSIFSSKTIGLSQIANILGNDDVHFVALARDLLQGNVPSSDLKPMNDLPDGFQSKALLLALLQLCREKGVASENFPFKSSDLEKLVDVEETSSYPETKLKKLLDPIVDCYCKLETAKNKLKTPNRVKI